MPVERLLPEGLLQISSLAMAATSYRNRNIARRLSLCSVSFHWLPSLCISTNTRDFYRIEHAWTGIHFATKKKFFSIAKTKISSMQSANASIRFTNSWVPWLLSVCQELQQNTNCYCETVHRYFLLQGLRSLSAINWQTTTQPLYYPQTF